MKPKVSVLVPVYMVGQYVERCAQSLLAQTYDNVEIVFVDDGSKDESATILERIKEENGLPDSQFSIIRFPENKGVAVARNKLLEVATGDFIQFVDSDDWAEPDMVETMLDKAMETGADIVGCSHYVTYLDKPEETNHVDYGSSAGEALSRALNYEISTELWKLLIRRSLIEDNCLRFVEGFDVGEDYPFTAKLYHYARIMAVVDRPLYHYVQYNPYRYSQTSLSTIESHIRAMQETERFCREVGIYNRVQPILDQRKLVIRNHFLLDGRFRDILRWCTLFPETNYLCVSKRWRERLLYFVGKALYGIFFQS